MKSEIKTIHEEQLETLLENLKVLENIKAGKLKCKFTGTVITLENIHSLFPESGDIKFVSNSPDAIKQLSVYLNDHKI